MQSKNSESGFSLIEALVALTIFSIIAVYMSDYISQSDRDSLKAVALVESKEQSSHLLRRIQREFIMRDSAVPITIEKNSLSFEKLSDNIGGKNYTMKLTTECIDEPSYLKDFPMLSKPNDKSISCLEDLDCAKGKLPQLRISYIDEQPEKADELYPSANNKTSAIKQAYALVGFASCFEDTPNGYRVRLVNVQKRVPNERDAHLWVEERRMLLNIKKRNGIDIQP